MLSLFHRLCLFCLLGLMYHEVAKSGCRRERMDSNPGRPKRVFSFAKWVASRGTGDGNVVGSVFKIKVFSGLAWVWQSISGLELARG